MNVKNISTYVLSSLYIIPGILIIYKSDVVPLYITNMFVGILIIFCGLNIIKTETK